MDHYRYMGEDLNDACRYVNPESAYLPSEIKKILPNWVDTDPDSEHMTLASRIEKAVTACRTGNLQDLIIRAGAIRKFLG